MKMPCDPIAVWYTTVDDYGKPVSRLIGHLHQTKGREKGSNGRAIVQTICAHLNKPWTDHERSVGLA